MHGDLDWNRSWKRGYDEIFHTRFETIIFNMVFFSLLGYALTYIFIATQEMLFIAIASVIFIGIFFYSLNYSAFAEFKGYSRLGGAFALLMVITLAAIFLPGFGDPYLDAILLFVITAMTVLLYLRRVKSKVRPELNGNAILFVLFLPVLLALGESFFLGFRFWETFPRSQWIYVFIPVMALFGYVEEGIFRGIMQRSLSYVTNGSMAVVLAAALNAAFMLIWGSILFAAFVFISGTVMGLLYQKSNSLIFVGTIHALQDTWLVLSLLFMGVVV